MYRLLIFSLLLVFWVILSGHFDAFHLSMGVLCAGIVTWLSSDMYFENRSKGAQVRVEEVCRAFGYAFWLLGQIVLANIQILKLALSPGGMEEVSPRVVRFKTKLRSDFAKYVLAQSITLTPGTVTVKIVGDEFVVHAISKAAADSLDGSMEDRIAHIFQSETMEPA